MEEMEEAADEKILEEVMEEMEEDAVNASELGVIVMEEMEEAADEDAVVVVLPLCRNKMSPW
jgi:hypothetical protein